jgi:capsule polysaccharide export protein KpsE/RkpR
LLKPRQYAATATLLAFAGQVPGSENNGDAAGAALLPVLTNQQMITDVVREFRLTDAPHSLTPGTFRRRALDVELRAGTDVVSLTVRLSQPDVAAKVANAVADRAVELARRVSLEAMQNRRGVIGQQLQQAQTNLRTAHDKLETFKKAAQVEVSRKDAETLLDRRGRLTMLNVQIAADQARLLKAREELGKHDQVRSARSVAVLRPPQDDEPKDPAKETRKGEVDEREAERQLDPGLELRPEARDPFVNPVHEYLDQQVSALSTRLAAATRERDELQRRLGLGEDRLAALNALYEKEANLKTLETEYEIARKTYVDFASTYEASRVELTGRSPQLVIIDRALSPEFPVSRNLARNAALAGFIALLGAGTIVLLMELLGGGGRPVSN